ncbi:MAG: glycosyltransferase, partial [Chloroflexota bacterium]|nr:glycosyltransferase [Chloroflexota bacterium]
IDRVIEIDYSEACHERTYARHLARPMRQTHNWRGAPILGYMYSIDQATHDYVVHFDGDLLLYQEPSRSWVGDGIALMQQVPEALFVAPLSGPPRPDGTLSQGTTPYERDPRGFYRFKKFTARKWLVDRRRLALFLPMQPMYKTASGIIKDVGADPSIRESPAWSWEGMVSARLAETEFVRADLDSPTAWALHPPDHGATFIAQLPDLIGKIERGWFPPAQAGDYDLRLDLWMEPTPTVTATRPQLEPVTPSRRPESDGNDAIADQTIEATPAAMPRRSVLSSASTVLAVIPHFRCEPWLADCLESLTTQTRPLDGIVVIDDGSGEPPVAIVEQFPEVTLLASAENVGPYRLIQEVINNTGYDAYLFQDADDWSAPNRLELLLREAERSGAELVGCQGIRILCDEGEALTYTWPLDANAALTIDPAGTALHHPSSLVARDLVMRLGGFATGLRYSGDVEFLRRAAHVARVVNIPEFCYFYRNRAGSLTSDPQTGLVSPVRRQLWADQHERARRNAALVAAGRRPDLAPMAVAGPVALSPLAGPSLRGVGTGPALWAASAGTSGTRHNTGLGFRMGLGGRR